jgi:Fe-S-cluster-containing hydrogenase component 2
MDKLLIFDAKKCVGCRTCEVSCSLTQTGVCNPMSSRRRVLRFEDPCVDIPMQCQQCGNAACMNICPTNAIYVEPETGAKIISDKCVGCRMCMIACPFGAITVDPLTKKVAKCDLCAGDPACARFCPTGAIEYTTADVYATMRQRQAVEEITRLFSSISQGGE